MPKKITRDYKIKRRNIWKTKSAKRNSDEKRVVNNVYIGAGNAQRWIILKKKLDYTSDKDFVSYLLDLADPSSGSIKPDVKAGRPNKDEVLQIEQKSNGLGEEETNDADSCTRSPISSPQDAGSDDGEWRPAGDGPLRRSPRKPTKSLRIHVRRSNRTSQTEKPKTHKKKKRKKSKNKSYGVDLREVSVVLEPVDGPPTLKAEAENQEFREAEREMPTLQAGAMEEEPPDEQEQEPEEPEEVEEPKPPQIVPIEADVTLPQTPAEPEDEADVHIEVGERVKLKRREKRRRQTTEDEMPSSSSKHSGKHKRKKHKHGEHGTKRKHHDIRKAPLEGYVDPPASPPPPPPPPPLPPPPQRVTSIKIKLCVDCNTRHTQDACPLLAPVMDVEDAVELEQWLLRQCTDKDVGQSPHSRCESEVVDDELEPSVLTYSVASLPRGLELQVVEPEHGLSVMAAKPLPQYARLGPLIGQPIKEMDIPDDFNMKDIWEANTTERVYVSTADPDRSNWLRYLRPAPTRDQRNLVPVVRNSQLWFYTLVAVAAGDELLYWADHANSMWSKKKMEKTNCGGCNLRFSHPSYYQLHCAVFHDPNFSLTIRKYHCKVCGVAVLGKENIMRHASEQHDGKGAYRCQFCNKFFLRLNYLEMHRTYGCAANPQRTRPLCDFCGRKFCQPQKLKVHIKRMHSDMAEVLREFQCKICLKLLGSRAALQRHMKEVHHKDIVGACTCDRCGKMFQNKSNLKIHMLTHSGVKPFKCRESSCNAAFTTKQCLQFHYKKVHSFSEGSMPAIERSVAYTFDAYSGGAREKPRRGKSTRFDPDDPDDPDDDSMLSMESSSSSLTAADVSSSNTDSANNCREEAPGLDEPPHLSPPHASHPIGSSPKQPPTLEAYPPPYKTPPVDYTDYSKPEDDEDESYVQPIYKVANKVSDSFTPLFKSTHKTLDSMDSYSYKKSCASPSPSVDAYTTYKSQLSRGESPTELDSYNYSKTTTKSVEDSGCLRGVSPRQEADPAYYKGGVSPRQEPEPAYYKGGVSPRLEADPDYYKGGVSPRQEAEPAYYKGGVSPRQEAESAYYKGGGSPRQEAEPGYYKLASVSPHQDVEPGYYGKVLSKGSKKWMPELGPRSPPDDTVIAIAKSAAYDFPDEKCSIEIVKLAESSDDGKGKLRVKPISSFRRPDSSTASLLVEAALDAAQRDIISADSASVITEMPGHMVQLADAIRESPIDYMHEGVMVSPPRHRLSPESHMESYMQRCSPEYLRHEDSSQHLDYSLHYHDEVMSPAATPRSHVEYTNQELASPSGTPNPRYELQAVDGLSSDDESSPVAQNLTKAKAAALQLYDDADEHGLDMSRAAPYHPFNPPLPPRYHLYDDRYSPPAYPEVLRVVSLDLTPSRHSVDLSLPRSSHHHPHHHLHQSRLLASPPGPPPLPNQSLMSPPPHPAYPSYLPPSPRTAQSQAYHHYSGYY